jgi:molecular chaperone DnaK (HSP70)
MSKETPITFSFLPLTIRIGTVGGLAAPVVLRGTPLPTKRASTFSTASDNQTSVEFNILFGESSLTRNDIFVIDLIKLYQKRSFENAPLFAMVLS